MIRLRFRHSAIRKIAARSSTFLLMKAACGSISGLLAEVYFLIIEV